MSVERAQEPGNGLLFYRARKLPGKFTGASRNTLSGPVKFPGKLPDKLTGPEITGTFEKQAPAPNWHDRSFDRALHRHCRVHWFESRSGFFQAFFSQLLKLCTDCEDLPFI